MSGKIVLTSLLVICIAAAYVLYGAFKNSPNYKELATSQMQVEFVAYAKLINKSDELKVAEENKTAYYLNINKPWSFTIHDKTLIIQAPALEPLPAPEFKNQIELQAKKSIETLALTWLVDKFHTKKDLLIDVRF